MGSIKTSEKNSHNKKSLFRILELKNQVEFDSSELEICYKKKLSVKQVQFWIQQLNHLNLESTEIMPFSIGAVSVITLWKLPR